MGRPKQDKPACAYFWFSDFEGSDKIRRFRMLCQQAGLPQTQADGIWLTAFRHSVHSTSPGKARGPLGRVASVDDWCVWFGEHDPTIARTWLRMLSEVGAMKRLGRAGHRFDMHAKCLPPKIHRRFFLDALSLPNSDPSGTVSDTPPGRVGKDRKSLLSGGDTQGENAPVRPAPKSRNPAASQLAQMFCGYRTGGKEQWAGVAERFADLLDHYGCAVQELNDEICRADRPKSEPSWELATRLRKDTKHGSQASAGVRRLAGES